VKFSPPTGDKRKITLQESSGVPFLPGDEEEESPIMNGDDPAPDSELEKARNLALRYRREFVDLRNFQLPPELLAEVPATLMLRYRFVPLAKMPDGRIAIAIADPSQLMLLDEISLLLRKRIVIHVAALTQINRILAG
jgi:type IV pilus assembly protein PilB